MTHLDIVKTLLDLALALIPHEAARAELDAAAIRRANALADAAETAKFKNDADEQ